MSPVSKAAIRLNTDTWKTIVDLRLLFFRYSIGACHNVRDMASAYTHNSISRDG